MSGKPHYLDDKRTCVLPVHLKAGMTYAITYFPDVISDPDCVRLFTEEVVPALTS